MASNPFDQFVDRIIAGARQSAVPTVAPSTPSPSPMPSAPPPQLAALAALGAAQRMQSQPQPQQSPVAMMAQQFAQQAPRSMPLPPLPDPAPFIQRSRPKTFGAVASKPKQPAAQDQQQALPGTFVLVSNKSTGEQSVLPAAVWNGTPDKTQFDLLGTNINAKDANNVLQAIEIPAKQTMSPVTGPQTPTPAQLDQTSPAQPRPEPAKKKGGILDTVTNALNKGGDALVQGGQNVAGAVQAAPGAINNDIIAPATQKAKDIGNAKGSDVVNTVDSVVGNTVKAGGQVADTGIGLVTGAYDTLPQPVKNVANPVLDTGKQGVGLVSSGVTSAVGNTVTAAGDVARQGLNATPQEVKDAAGTGATKVLSAADKPRQVNVTLASDSMYDTYVLGKNDPTLDPKRIVEGAAAGWIIKVTDTVAKYTGGQSYVDWLQKNPDLAKSVYENGYDSNGDGKIDYKGGRALWEAYVGTLNSAQRGIIDTFVDPTNAAAGVGEAGVAVSAVGKTIQGAEDLSRVERGAGAVLRGAGIAMQVPTAVLDKSVDYIFDAAGQAIKAMPGIGHLLSESTRSAKERQLGQAAGSLTEVQNQPRITPGGTLLDAGPITPPEKLPPGIQGPPIPGEPKQLTGGTQLPDGSPVTPNGPVQTVTDLASKETNGDASLTPGGQDVAGKPITEVPPEPTVPDESGILNVKPNEKQVIVNTTGQADDWELFDTAGNRQTEPTTWENLWKSSTVEQMPDGSVVLTPGESIAKLTSPEARSAANGGMPEAPTPEVPTAPEPAPANDLAAETWPGEPRTRQQKIDEREQQAGRKLFTYELDNIRADYGRSRTLWAEAKHAPTKEDGLAVIDRHYTDAYGPRFQSVHEGATGWGRKGVGEVYNADGKGRGWKLADREKETFSRAWDEMHGDAAPAADYAAPRTTAGDLRSPRNDLAAAPAPVETQEAPQATEPVATTPDTSPIATTPQATVRPSRWVDPNSLPEPITGISNPDAEIHYGTNIQQPLKKRLASIMSNQSWDHAQSGAYHELQRAREVTQHVDRLQEMFPGTKAKVTRPDLPADAEAQDMQRVLYEPWAQTSDARKNLYVSTRIKEDVVAARRQLVPGENNATKAMPFRSYVEMVDTHARIVPGDLNDPTFQKAMDKADRLRPIVDTATGGNTINTVPYNRSPGAVGIITNPKANAAQFANSTKAKLNRYVELAAESRQRVDTGLASGSNAESKTVRGRAVGDLQAQDMAITMPVKRETKGSFAARKEADLTSPQETMLQRYDRLATEHEAAGLSPEEADAKAFEQTKSDFNAYFRDAFGSRVTDDSWKAVRLLQDGTNGLIQLHREATLTNPFTGVRYVANNYVGNAFQLAWTGHGDAALKALDPREILRTKREMSIADAADLTSPVYVKARQRGVTIRNDVRSMQSNMEIGQGDKTQWEKFLGAVTANTPLVRSRRLGEIVSHAFSSKGIRDTAHGVELSSRELLMDHVVDKDWGQVLFDTTSMVEKETKGRVSPQAMTDWIGQQPGMSFSQADLREWLVTQGVNQGQAIHIGRNYQNAANAVYRDAGKEVRRVMFSGKTNLDEAMGKAFAFHYWLTRASVLYAKETLKSPAKLAAYGRAVAGMKKLQEEGQVPSSLNGYFRALEGTFGFDVFMNPGANVSTLLLSLGDPASFTPEDQNGLVTWLSHRGLMLSAPLGAAIAALGLGGQGQVNDPLGVSTVLRLPIALVNYVNAMTGGDIKNGVVTDPWQGLLQKIREQTSGVSQAIGVPGATKIYALSGDENQNREINELILTIAAEKGIISPDVAERAKQAGIDGQALPDDVVTAMDNPDSPLWQEAYKRWAIKEVALNALRGSPAGIFYPTVKTTTRDTSQRLLNDMATSPEVKSQLYDERNQTNAATPEAASLSSNVDQYSRIGTDQQRATYKTYNDIMYGNPSTVRVGNWIYTGAEIQAMTPDQRKTLANQWLDAEGYDTPVVSQDQFDNMSPEAQQRVLDAGEPVTARQQNDDYLAQRKAFKDQSSPEFQQYKAWQTYVGNYTGGATQYWQDQIASNPSAAEYYRRLPADQQTNTSSLMSPDAFLALQGKQGDYRSAPGIPTSNGNSPNPLGMPASGSGSGSGTGGSGGSSGTSAPKSDKQTIQDQLDSYQQGLNDVYAFEQQTYGQTFDPNDMNPMSRGAMLKVLANNGLSMPSMGSKAAAYQRWVAAQTPGTDTSIDAYLKWMGYTTATQSLNLNPQPAATAP